MNPMTQLLVVILVGSVVMNVVAGFTVQWLKDDLREEIAVSERLRGNAAMLQLSIDEQNAAILSLQTEAMDRKAEYEKRLLQAVADRRQLQVSLTQELEEARTGEQSCLAAESLINQFYSF